MAFAVTDNIIAVRVLKGKLYAPGIPLKYTEMMLLSYRIEALDAAGACEATIISPEQMVFDHGVLLSASFTLEGWGDAVSEGLRGNSGAWLFVDEIPLARFYATHWIETTVGEVAHHHVSDYQPNLFIPLDDESIVKIKGTFQNVKAGEGCYMTAEAFILIAKEP